MKNIAFYCLSFLLFGCNSVGNNNISDLESFQLKTSFIDLDENNLDLSVFNEGKIVISYWATWCAPCIKEMPSMKRAEKIFLVLLSFSALTLVLTIITPAPP